MLKGKTVLLGVSAGIAAYKAPYIARLLKKLNCNVHALLTPNAQHFVTPLTMETVTQNKCITDTFDRIFQYSTEHIALARQADAVLIAPATADVIGKLANGIADDMLTTTVMACTCPKIIAPSMNHYMYHNGILQDNLDKLHKYGFEVIAPDNGFLACGDVGDGKMPSEQALVEYVLRAIAAEKDLAGRKILVTAGATREAIDPVRFITNHSSGKMGCAIAKAAMLRGAEVTLICGKTEVDPPHFVKLIKINSAEEMFDAVKTKCDNSDIIIKAAAVADYRPSSVGTDKIKKSEGSLTIETERTTDILKYLGEHRRPHQFLCGFSMETKDVLENSRRKLKSKNVQMICANSLTEKGAGFGTDTNVITLITDKDETELGLLSKEEAANKILDKILDMMSKD